MKKYYLSTPLYYVNAAPTDNAFPKAGRHRVRKPSGP